MPDPIKPTAADYAAAENAASAANLVTNDGYYEFDLEKLTEAFALHAQQAREQALEEHDDELAGAIAYQISKTYVMDVSTARAAIDRARASIRALKEQRPC